jgi:hypothetical protein
VLLTSDDLGLVLLISEDLLVVSLISEELTVVLLKIEVFWDVMPCLCIFVTTILQELSILCKMLM